MSHPALIYLYTGHFEALPAICSPVATGAGSGDTAPEEACGVSTVYAANKSPVGIHCGDNPAGANRTTLGNANHCAFAANSHVNASTVSTNKSAVVGSRIA